MPRIELPEADILVLIYRNGLFYTATYSVSAALLAKILDISNETLYSTGPQVPGSYFPSSLRLFQANRELRNIALGLPCSPWKHSADLKKGGVFWGFAFEPLPTQVTKFGPLKGGNSLGTTPADGNGVGK